MFKEKYSSTFIFLVVALTYFLLGFLTVSGQDLIHTLEGKIIPGHILSIDKKIAYNLNGQKGGPTIFIKTKEVAFILYENGDLDLVEKNSTRHIAFGHPSHDMILTTSGSFHPMDSVRMVGNNLKGISLADPSHPRVNIGLPNVLANWNRDRELVLFSSPINVLNAMLKAPPAGLVYPFVPPAQDQEKKEESPFPELDSLSDEEAQEDSPRVEMPIPMDMEKYRELATFKVKRLQHYIKVISDKSTPSPVAADAVEEALVLFVSDTCSVQISSINKPDSEPREESIRRYFKNLKSLLYEKVEIEWVDLYFISDLKMDPQGNYVGTVSFVQIFTGYVDGKPVYKDKTTKSVNIILKKYEKYANGEGEDLWDVLLSDIMVELTERV